ncbi:MAG: GAF domain-containing protein [Gammaproteobacteria bacterium]|nr:GAF domain-containing protein [Gammaproteobacteria bacterium]
MKFSSIGLRARLLLLVLFAIVPTFVFSGYTTLREFSEDAAEAKRVTMAAVQFAAQQQNQMLAATRQLLITLSQLSELKRPSSTAACNRMLATLQQSFPLYTNIGVAALDGDIYCNWRALARRINIADRSYFRRAVESGDFSVGDYQIGRVTGINAINFGYPVRDERGAVRAIVYAALDLRWLEKFLAATKLPAGSMLTVVDGRGTVLANYPESNRWVGKNVADAPLIKTILAHGTDDSAEITGLDGTDRLYAFNVLQDSATGNVYVAVGIPTDAAFATAREDLRRNILLMSVVALLILFGAWTGSNALVLKRVNALSHAAQRLAKGDLNARTGLAPGNEELGQLAHSFDDMASALQRVNRAMKTLSAGNRALVRAEDEPSLLAEMCRVIVDIGGYRFAWIGYTQDDEHKTVRPIAQAGFDGELATLTEEMGTITWSDDERGRGAVGSAIRSAQPCVVRNIPTDSNFAPWRAFVTRHGLASAVAFPLRVREKIIGALAIYSQEIDAFDTEELELLSEAAQDLAFGIGSARTRVAHDSAQQTIVHLARYDRLTGLPNHAHFEERLPQALTQIGDVGRVATSTIAKEAHRDPMRAAHKII